jgi:hypothetical protein
MRGQLPDLRGREERFSFHRSLYCSRAYYTCSASRAEQALGPVSCAPTPLCDLYSLRAGAQTPPALEKITSLVELEKTIAIFDTALFDAYNHCDVEKFAWLLSENVEFYCNRLH